MGFPLTARQIFKISCNNNLWITLLTIVHDNQLDLCLHKVKAHDNDPYNEAADRLARDAHTSDLVMNIIDYNNSCLNYVPLWNNIRIETNLRKFLTQLSWNKGFEKFFNLYRNH